MKKSFIGLLISLAIVSSCSKKDSLPSTALVGKWVFTNQVITSFAYPWVLHNNSFPIATSNFSTTLDSIQIVFDNNGNYIFRNFHLPIDNGTYTIAQDSFIIINPPTADFVKFNYVMPSLSAFVDTLPGVIPPATYTPYSNFQYTSDTILFRKTSNNGLVFSGSWLIKASQPLIPTNDTLILNQSFNYFKKQ